MKLQCPHCKAAGSIPDERLPSKPANIRCPKCGKTFAFTPEQPAEVSFIPEPVTPSSGRETKSAQPVKRQEIKARETTIVLLKPSYKNYIPEFVLAAVLMIFSFAMMMPTGGGSKILFLAALYFIVVPAIKRETHRYTITSERAIARRGIFSNRTDEVRLRDIRSVHVRQGIAQRAFGIGNLLMASAGTAGLEISFKGIVDPDLWKETLYDLINQLN